MSFGDHRTSGLVKEKLAGVIREEILSGRLKQGETIVEGTWARRFEVGQSSIREAINLLVADGFVEKTPGRSARVTNFTSQDVEQIYIVRARIEGLAVRLVTELRPDLSELDQAVADMRAAAERGNIRALVERDLRFHMLIFENCGNRFLVEYARRLLYPLFAFQMTRMLHRMAGPESWAAAFAEHQKMVDLMREGDTDRAESYAMEAIGRFADAGRHVWIEDDLEANQKATLAGDAVAQPLKAV